MTEPGAARYPADKFRYARIFDPRLPEPPELDMALNGGDRARQSPYAYDEEIILAVNTALAANRPLLVAGPPGTGKSALAADIHRQLLADRTFAVEYTETAITGRSEGRDLLWSFDTVRRLRDAQLGAITKNHASATTDPPPPADPASRAKRPADPLDPNNYLNRGVLWKAFDASHRKVRMVVLIDEIDKADPDVPNHLLEVLGSGKFYVDELDEDVIVDDAYAPIIIITTNDERELSRPFRRRCVALTLRPPGSDRLLEIADAQGLATNTSAADAAISDPAAEDVSGARATAPRPATAGGEEQADPAEDDNKLTVRELATALAEEIIKLAGTPEEPGELTPNAAEYLDALRACLKLGVVNLRSVEWKAIRDATLIKSLRPDVR